MEVTLLLCWTYSLQCFCHMAEPSGGGGCTTMPKLTSNHKLAECIEIISQLPTAVLCDNLPAEWQPRRGREERRSFRRIGLTLLPTALASAS